MAKSDAILERLLRLHPKKIDLSLGRVLGLLERLGNPHEHLPPVVHVAGTNGKGSTVAFLRAMLEAAGYRAHVYTSPHLVRFNERIRLAGSLIEEDALSDLLEVCEATNQGEQITYFEITTAAAFKAFADTSADIVLLECGLGGRYDATNVVKQPALTAITPISMDHMQFLGNTLAGIADEKAAIQKHGVTTIVGPQMPIAAQVIEDAAKAQGASLYRAGAEWHSTWEDDALIFEDAQGRRRFPLPALPGPHQIDNAGLAIAGLGNLDEFRVNDAAISQGLKTAEWPARVQRLAAGKLVELLPPGWELWLDGGHNAAAGEMLAAFAAEWTDRALHLIFGMLNSKEATDFLRPLAARAIGLHGVAIPNEEASLSASEATKAGHAVGLSAAPAAGFAAAIQTIVQQNPVPGRILICGSLYLAGQVLAEND